MDHGEVREILEDAAVEPGGLDRLMAGDTSTAALVASHLAACPDCTDELDRLRRSVGVIAPVIRTTPAPELRDRTLAYVTALGRPRGETSPPLAGMTPRPAAGAAVNGGAASTVVPLRRRRSFAPWLAAAAALIVAVVGTALVTNASRDADLQSRAAQLAAQSAQIEDLGEVARWTLRVDGQPDARRVALAGATGNGAGPTGTLVYSPSTTEVVIVADGLTEPAAGKEYRCWVEVDGKRTPIGRMFFAGSLSYWVGASEPVAGVDASTAFGVTLVDVNAPAGPGQDVLVSRS